MVALVGPLAWWWTGGAAVVDTPEATVLVSERTGYGMEAAIPGVIEVVGGCLGVNGQVVVWPHGTDVVDDDPLTLDLPGHGQVSLGHEVMLGGGFVHEPPQDEPRDDLVVGGAPVPEPCTHHPVALTHDR
ncbi:hypothetical protein GCM10009623_25540 [Nocardioides aestuarii]